MPETELEKSLDTIFVMFSYYAMLDKPRDKLSRAEFSQLLREQLPNLLQESRTREATDSLFKETDRNADLLVSYDEFLNLIEQFLDNKYRTFHPDP